MKKNALAAARLDQARQAAKASTPGSPAPAAPRRGGKWLIPVLAIALTATASYGLFHFVLFSRIPRPMLGSWVVTEGAAMEDAILEFRRDGTMVATVKMRDKAGKFVAGKIATTVEVDGDTLRTTSLHPVTGEPQTDVHRIQQLTDEEFVFVDSKGIAIKMKRLYD